MRRRRRCRAGRVRRAPPDGGWSRRRGRYVAEVRAAIDAAVHDGLRAVRGGAATEWFYEDDDCWIAECGACRVPMVVWNVHDPDPPDEIKACSTPGCRRDHREFEDDHCVDDDLRSVPTHYHAHARPRGGFAAMEYSSGPRADMPIRGNGRPAL